VTSVNGAIVDPEGLLGRIVPGAPADLIAVRGDPVRDIGILADSDKLILIMKDGSVVKNSLVPGGHGKLEQDFETPDESARHRWQAETSLAHSPISGIRSSTA